MTANATKDAAPKIPPKRVKTDDCEIHPDQVIVDGQIVDRGEGYFTHVGEWVELIPLITVGELISVGRMQDNDDDETQVLVIAHEFEALCEKLSKRIWAWNWTDMMGRPFEQPFERPDVLANLSSEELVYLVGITGSSQETRKNGSAPSGATSSETRTRRNQSKQS